MRRQQQGGGVVWATCLLCFRADNVQTQPVDVVAVLVMSGKARTGKSYLMNRLVGNTKGGFAVGSAVQHCTEGVWIWGKTGATVLHSTLPHTPVSDRLAQRTVLCGQASPLR